MVLCKKVIWSFSTGIDLVLHGWILLERSSLPSKNFLCISMDMLQIGALVLVGCLVEAGDPTLWHSNMSVCDEATPYEDT